MISWWRQFANIFSKGTVPLVYLQLGYHVLVISSRVCYTIKTSLGIEDLFQAHRYAASSEATTGYQMKMEKLMTCNAFTGYFMYLGGFAALNLALYTFNDQGNWDWGLAEFIQTFGCYARKVFTWATENECPDDIFFSLKMVPIDEILYGSFGVLTYVSGTLVDINTTLVIMSSCLSPLSASNSLTNDVMHDSPPQGAIGDGTPRSLRTRYDFLDQFAVKISSFVGLILLLTLCVIGLSMPNVLDGVFNYYTFSVATVLLPIFMVLLSCLFACVSASQIEALEDKLTEEGNIEQLPNDIRRLLIYIHRLFRRSAGIGYRGLFVMNFVYLFTYCSTVAGLTAFTYDAKKRINEDIKKT